MNVTKYVDDLWGELERKKYSFCSIENYCNSVTLFLNGFKHLDSPTRINEQMIKDYLRKINKHNTQRAFHSAIKCFYKYVMKQPNKFKYIEYCKKAETHPIILSMEETKRLFNACSNIKHKTIMMVAYATGARVGEILNMRLCDIDRANMVIHIMNGKGSKQRPVTMKPELLKMLENYYKIYRPKTYIFEGQNQGEKYTDSSINQFLKKYAQLAGIKKKVHIHLLRHLFATHSLEAGENLYVTQKALGHSDPKITANTYYHISPNIIANAYSPIQNVINP